MIKESGKDKSNPATADSGPAPEASVKEEACPELNGPGPGGPTSASGGAPVPEEPESSKKSSPLGNPTGGNTCVDGSTPIGPGSEGKTSSTPTTPAVPNDNSAVGTAPLPIGSTNAGTVVSARVRPPSNNSADVTVEPKIEENSTDNPSSCAIVKNELNGSSLHEFNSEESDEKKKSGVNVGVGLSGSGAPLSGPPLAPNGVQPLPSNVINKQPGTLEAQYMQQQSQIFVFSTQLANKSAEAVLHGHANSIIAFHCAQPGTKKYLEKHPLKTNQFSRQNPAQWLNNLAQMKQKGHPGPVGIGPPPTNVGMKPGMSPSGFHEMGPAPGPDMWNSGGPNQMMMGGPGPSPCTRPMKNPGGMDNVACMMSNSPSHTAGPHHSPASPCNLMNPQPSLTGVKVPDENLTPQQRQHREEQLAMIRFMTQILLPEQTGSGSPGPPPDQSPYQQPPVQQHHQDPMMSMMHKHGMPGPHNSAPMGNMGSMPHNQITPAAVAAQIEWQKLQHQFYEDRKKKGPSAGPGPTPGSMSVGMGSPAGMGSQTVPRGPGTNGQGQRGQGPPPPYHQTPRSASVPTAMPSPNPGSPNPPTSNLSLPSPHGTSALNSPADSGRRFVGAGPSPTGLDSPSASRPLNSNISNPGTPLATHLSPGRKDSQNTTQSSSDFPATPTSQVPGSSKSGPTTSTPGKEPNLMPVPSPQQIQYLNTFEGQELTIQKQPNTSLKETNIQSPSVSATSATLEAGPSTPLTPTSLEIGGNRFGPSSNTTDVGANRYPVPSPHTPGGESKPPTVPTSQSLTGTPQPTGPPTNTGSAPSTGQSTGQPPQPQNSGPPPPTPGSGPNTPSGQSRYPGPGSGPGAPPLVKTPNSDVGSRFLTSSPQLTPDGMGPPRFPSQGPIPPPLSNPNFMNQPKVGPGPLFMDSPSSGPSSPYTPRADNVPLNPGIPCNGKGSHFDPITSMAQMSQQLTSQVANSPGGSQPPGGMGMMPFNAGGMHPMQMNDMGMPPMPNMTEPTQGPPQMQFNPVTNTAGPVMNQPMCSVSPKPCNMMMGMVPPRVQVPGQYPGNPMPQRMLGRPAGPNPYNGANVQVKASAPNTIQYLPAKPQPGSSGPRAPPSLEFLQRYTNPNPLSNLDSKVPTHNLQYFPNGGQPNPGMPPMNMPMNRPNGMMGPVGSCGPHPGHPGNPVNGPMMGMGMGGPGNMIMSAGPGMGMAPMRGGLRPGPPGPGASLGMMRMQPMPGGGGGPPGMYGGMSGSPNQPGGPPESMYGPGPNMGPSIPGNMSGPPTGPQPPQQLFVPGSKSSPMGLGAPDASQPLPPSMSQTTNFKNSPFIGPTTADPNYAQQFHNFQQQLYATNTRSQLNQQNPQQMGPNPNFFVSK